MLLILTLLLAFPIALAANGDDQCRNMNGHGVYGDDNFQAPCEFDGTDYDPPGRCYQCPILTSFANHFRFGDVGSVGASKGSALLTPT